MSSQGPARLAIAQGKHRPAADEPKLWFTSVESFARVLSDRNRRVLEIIAGQAPESLAQLAELTGRQKSNLSRTLKTMERYGFIKLERGPRGSVIPKVPIPADLLSRSARKRPPNSCGSEGQPRRADSAECRHRHSC
ncbi:MAG: helix-turn-helix domain-containing protein [Bryobacterales bacterium]|nr:helix-turn-helix domain-containing protein [Bryobacterales bacterium]